MRINNVDPAEVALLGGAAAAVKGRDSRRFEFAAPMRTRTDQRHGHLRFCVVIRATFGDWERRQEPCRRRCEWPHPSPKYDLRKRQGTRGRATQIDPQKACRRPPQRVRLGAMFDSDEEIREIKKEIIESRGLTIKTNNLVASLGADIKAIAKRQAGYERRFNWNGGVFLVVVAILSFAGLKFASDARISEIESEMSRLRRSVTELEQDLNEETNRAEQRAHAESAAGRFYALIRQQRRSDVVEQYQSIANEDLSSAEAAFFRDTYDRFRLDLSVAAYQNGLEMMRNARYAEGAEKFQESIRLREEAAHIPSVKYHLARALRQLGRQSEAMVYARQVVEQNVDRELQDDATWLLSRCAEELDDIDTAREALRTLIRRWPRSSLARDARPHLRELTRRAIRGRQEARASSMH